MGDSFGDNVWIDVAKARGCRPSCLCRSLDKSAEEDIFAFTVTKNSASLHIQIHSDELRREVLGMVSPGTHDDDAFNGLDLLTHHCSLLEKLIRLFVLELERHLEKGVGCKDTPRVLAEFSLLHTILIDPEIFKSFGFEELHKHAACSLAFRSALLRRISYVVGVPLSNQGLYNTTLRSYFLSS